MLFRFLTTVWAKEKKKWTIVIFGWMLLFLTKRKWNKEVNFISSDHTLTWGTYVKVLKIPSKQVRWQNWIQNQISFSVHATNALALIPVTSASPLPLPPSSSLPPSFSQSVIFSLSLFLSLSPPPPPPSHAPTPSSSLPRSFSLSVSLSVPPSLYQKRNKHKKIHISVIENSSTD